MQKSLRQEAKGTYFVSPMIQDPSLREIDVLRKEIRAMEKSVIWIPRLSRDSLSRVNIHVSAIGDINVEWKLDAIEEKTLITILWRRAKGKIKYRRS